MTQELWTAVDEYLEETFLAPDAALEEALHTSDAAGLPAHHVSANQGQFLMLLARSLGARRILELGTLAGYSSIWLARALPEDGRLVTLELNPRHAAIAQQNIARAGLGHKVEIRVGAALEGLAQAAAANEAPFDFIFIDADKQNSVGYFEEALRLARPGTVIVMDNVIRAGAVLDASREDERVQGLRRCNARIAEEPRVLAATLQTVGSKGYDGFSMLLVTG